MTIHMHIVIPVKPFVMPIAFLEPVNFFYTNFPNLHAHPITSGKSAAHCLNFPQKVAP